MKRPVLSLLLVLACLPPVAAQQMRVEDFAVQHRPLLKPAEVPVDKGAALLDFVTAEKGFSFLAGGKQPAAAEEGEGVITVTLPHKTAYVTIRHPDFGQLVWRVPNGRYLKRRHHYRAQLLTLDPAKDFKSPNQWVVFHVAPENALISVDSLTRPVRREVVEYLLPVGEHSYRVEAPFHEAVEGTLTLTDSLRLDIPVTLQPFYSFLTVKMPAGSGELFIDSAPILREEATSYRLGEGYHRVNLFRGQTCYYDSLLFVGKAEKKVLELSERDLYPRERRRTAPLVVNPPVQADGEKPSEAPVPAAGAPVKLMAADSLTRILVDREPLGWGQWEGTLETGFHLAQTVRDGLESEPTWLWVDDDFPQEVNLASPGTGYGLLNIYCNVAGAGIRIDGKDFGQTPRIVRLDASHTYEVRLSKPGFRDGRKSIRPRGNQEVEVYMKLKKRKKI